jgi:hypothetical protein
LYTTFVLIFTGNMDLLPVPGAELAQLQQQHQPQHGRGPNPPVTAAPPPGHDKQLPKESETYQGLDLGSGYKQCSVSRAAANTMNVTEIKNGLCITAATGAPKIGGLD